MHISFNDFQKQNKEEWIEKINFELKGSKKVADLDYVIEDGLAINPFLTNEDAVSGLAIPGINTKSGVFINGKTDQEKNQNALAYLSLGAQSLSIKVNRADDLDVLLEGIFLNYITTIFCFDEEVLSGRTELQAYLIEKYHDQIIDIIFQGSQAVSGYKNLICSVQNNTSFLDRLQTITESLYQYVDQHNVGLLVVECALKSDFLAQIAELKAIRVLWSHILNAKSISFAPITIIAKVGDIDMSADKHPLISINYAMMSAYFGMADYCFGPPNADEELTRLSLHTQNVFKEEAYLDKVLDPTSGSYFIDTLIKKMVDLTWQKVSFSDL